MLKTSQRTLVWLAVVAIAIGCLSYWFKRPLDNTTSNQSATIENRAEVSASKTKTSSTNNNIVASVKSVEPYTRLSGNTLTTSAQAEQSIASHRTWLEFQANERLRPRILQGMLSNDLQEVVAASRMRVHCGLLSGVLNQSAKEVAKNSMYRFNGDESIIRGTESDRIFHIEKVRLRCMADETERIAEDNNVKTALGTMTPVLPIFKVTIDPGTGLLNLTQQQRALLSEVGLPLYDSLLRRISSDVENHFTTELTLFTGSIGYHLAMCQLGDDCSANSLRASMICINHGICTKLNVNESIALALANRPDYLNSAQAVAAKMIVLIR